MPRDFSLHHSVHTSWGLSGLERPRNETNHRRRSCDTGESERSSPPTVLPTVPHLPFSPYLSNSVPNSVPRSHAKFEVSTPIPFCIMNPHSNLLLLYASSFRLSGSSQAASTFFLRGSVFVCFCISVFVSQPSSHSHAGYVHEVDVC